MCVLNFNNLVNLSHHEFCPYFNYSWRKFGSMLPLLNGYAKYYLWPIAMTSSKAELAISGDGSHMGMI